MGAFLRGLLRWTLAIVVLGGIAWYAVPAALEAAQGSISIADEESELAAPTPSASPAITGGPVEASTEEPVADATVVAGTIADLDSETLVIGPGQVDAVAVAFPQVEGDPRCVESATLLMWVEEGSEAELLVYPSGITDLASASLGPIEELRLDPAPQAVAVTDGSPGQLRWDVSNMYRTWALGQPFTTGGVAPEGAPFTVVVKPKVEAEPGREVVFGSVESGSPPTLEITGVEGCGAPAPEATDA